MTQVLSIATATNRFDGKNTFWVPCEPRPKRIQTEGKILWGTNCKIHSIWSGSVSSISTEKAEELPQGTTHEQKWHIKYPKQLFRFWVTVSMIICIVGSFWSFFTTVSSRFLTHQWCVLFLIAIVAIFNLGVVALCFYNTEHMQLNLFEWVQIFTKIN